MAEAQETITGILLSSRDSSQAVEHLLPLVYEELRKIASSQLRRLPSGHTLQTTDLVHEAYLRLFDPSLLGWQHRHHFFASAAQAMRHILIDHARRRTAQKRTPPDLAHELALEAAIVLPVDVDVLALDAVLTELGRISPRQAQIVELRYFAGLTQTEVAELLDLAERTVAREWQTARLWLSREMRR